jgi:hypothetical protein
MEKKKKSKHLKKMIVQSLPLAAAAGSSFLPLQRFGQQVTMLVVLVWLQVFFIIECFIANK